MPFYIIVSVCLLSDEHEFLSQLKLNKWDRLKVKLSAIIEISFIHTNTFLCLISSSEASEDSIACFLDDSSK